MNCTEYTRVEYGELNFIPCQCPVCGGFLKWVNDEPICNKCRTELLIIPERDDDGNEKPWGKICPISKPKKVME